MAQKKVFLAGADVVGGVTGYALAMTGDDAEETGKATSDIAEELGITETAKENNETEKDYIGEFFQSAKQLLKDRKDPANMAVVSSVETDKEKVENERELIGVEFNEDDIKKMDARDLETAKNNGL